jgi:uncharacterized protein YdhG (YjbR/CyaY superfamily)
MAAKQAFRSVDEYLTAQSPAAQEILESVRGAIRKALPKADESISYNLPTYKLNGRVVIYFAGWKKHFSIYPAGARMLAEFPELANYEVNKGTIKFALEQPAPVKLIARLAKFRAEEAASEAKAKSASR